MTCIEKAAGIVALAAARLKSDGAAAVLAELGMLP